MALDPTRLIAAMNRLFSTLPLPNAGADPREALRTYCEACEGYSTADVELAVKQFINGVVKGVNPAFAPTAPQFVNQMRANAEYNAKIVAGRQQLLEQFREQELDEKWASRRTPEAKAKVQSMIDAIKAEEKADKRTPEEVQKAKDDLAKQDQFFAEQFIKSPSGVPVSKSLAALMGVTSYNTADDDKYDMGGMLP